MEGVLFYHELPLAARIFSFHFKPYHCKHTFALSLLDAEGACKQALVEIPPTGMKEAVALLASLLLEMASVTFDTDEGQGDTSMERQTNVCADFFAERGKRQEPAVLAITRDMVSLMCPRPRMGESTSVGGLPSTITVRSADLIEKEKFVILAPAHNGRPRIRVIRNSQPPFQWLSPHHWVALRTSIRPSSSHTPSQSRPCTGQNKGATLNKAGTGWIVSRPRSQRLTTMTSGCFLRKLNFCWNSP
jgi:hypothetical protein